MTLFCIGGLMANAPHASILFRLGRARRPIPVVPEPADFGTAFGLEMSLGEPAPAPVPAEMPRWLARLRSKPAP
jgi:hypothetical protein